MRILILFFLIFKSFSLTSQITQIEINWDGEKQYSIGEKSLVVPKTKNFENNYSFGDYFKIVKQWESDKIIDKSSVQISNIVYSVIDIENYPGLDKINFDKEANINFNSSVSNNKIFSFLELDPIIFHDGTYKKVESFDINYVFSNIPKNRKGFIHPSVMRNGDWYQFFVEESGIHKIDKNFLENLGVNTQSIDPGNIKIFGHGGQMLSMENTDDFLIDPQENSIKIIGEEDGSFDANDYILFYASGPNGYNSESNTNLNLYTDRISYFLCIGPENGLRVNDLVEPEGESSISIDYYTNYQFYENDNYNLAKIGRRWFGDRFDFENIKTFSFEIDNLIVEQPVNLKISAAATSEIVTTMSIDLNGSQLSSMVFGSIGDPILATGDSYSAEINLNSSQANITLAYNNNGNPASSAYLDYISIEAISSLNFSDGQLTFYNNNLDFESAQNVENYSLYGFSDSVEIESANLIYGRKVSLTLSSSGYGGMVMVQGLLDNSGNVVDPDYNSASVDELLVVPHLVGDFNDWNPANHDYDFTLNPNGIWELSIDLPAGTYGYKVLESDEWNDNDWPGTNQSIILENQEEVTFFANCGFYTGVRNWDEFVTHLDPVIVGSFLDTLALGNNWDPSNTIGAMNDQDGDGVFTWEVLIPEGDWEYKVVLNQNWDQDTYGNGGNFYVTSDGILPTTFNYNFRQNSTFYTTPSDNCVIGDINGDNNIDVLDVVSVVNFILGNIIEVPCADYNEDSNIDILDVVGIVSVILGN